MKKRLPLLFLALLSLVTAKAEVISQDAARQKAMNFLTNRLQIGKRVAVRGVHEQLKAAESCDTYHIFNIGDADGYVVVSGDDRMPDILGYSDNGYFDGKSIPDNLRGWLQGYERQYEYLKAHPDAKLTSRGADSRKPIAPMLECHWNQWAPYNDLCPEGCPTGCVATAMAQIMYYHKWPKQTTKTIPAYTTETNKYEIPSIGVTTIDWDNMLPTYNSSSSEASRKAVATLMKLCGAAVQMDYDVSNSGAYTDGSAFAKYFDYEESICLFDRKDFSLDKWTNMIYEELENRQPVLYSGRDRTSAMGHSFVVDGYDSNDYFHINFGWGGYCDAFFLLSAISTEDGVDFSYEQDAVVHIQPTSSTKPEPYMTVDNGTLTFCYDNDRDKSKVPTYDYSTSSKDFDLLSQITHVIISPSFANYTLYSLNRWFYGFSNVETIEGLGNLNTSNVTDMYGMFWGCSSLTSLDVSNFDTSNVINMDRMFMYCSGLTSLDVSNFDTSNVKYMGSCNGGMFLGCRGLTSLDVSNFNTSNVRDMSNMFSNCSGLTSLDVSKFDTSNVTWMDHMFAWCYGLTSLDVSNFDTSNVTSMYGMFLGCFGLTSLDVSKFNTSNVTDMGGLFERCSDLTSLDVSNFNTSNVTSMNGMFDGCRWLTSLDVSNFDTSNVTNMGYMFASCNSLETIFASDAWSTDKIESSQYMFSSCYGLVGGKGTKYLDCYVDDHTYARIDGGESSPGYFTALGLKGDCNGDGKVNEADVAELENYIMGRPSDKFKKSAADMNYDGVINAADIVLLINMVQK